MAEVATHSASAQRPTRRLLKRLAGTAVPLPRVLARTLYRERTLRHLLWRGFKSKLYYEPMLRAQATRVGTGLMLYDDIPKLFGQLDIKIGHRVRLEGDHSWVGMHESLGTSELVIGDDTYLGYQVLLYVGRSIRFGRHILVANRVQFFGYDAHPTDPFKRAANLAPDDANGTIAVDDYAWISNNVTIVKNVRIGAGAIVAAHSVVTRDVPPLTVVAGNPARVVREIEAPAGWPYSNE